MCPPFSTSSTSGGSSGTTCRKAAAITFVSVKPSSLNIISLSKSEKIYNKNWLEIGDIFHVGDRRFQTGIPSSSFMLLMPNANRLNPTPTCFACHQFVINRHQNGYCHHTQKSEIKNDLLYKISIQSLFNRTFLSSLGDYLFNFSKTQSQIVYQLHVSAFR